jgi:hypothetical protein
MTSQVTNSVSNISNYSHVIDSNVCGFVDMNGKSCKSKGVYNNFCTIHNEITNQLKKYMEWMEVVEFHNKYIYYGKHWEKEDDVYHYISRDRLIDNSINDFNEWDYDQEIWIGDKLWPFCGPHGYNHTMKNYSIDFEHQLQLKALVKI